MFALEADWLSRHQADAGDDTDSDLLLYQFLGHRSQRQRRLRRRQVELNRIRFQLEQAGAALDGGHLSLAERILKRTSHTLGILLEDDVARLRPTPPRDPGSPTTESTSFTSPSTRPAQGRSPAPSREPGRHPAPFR